MYPLVDHQALKSHRWPWSNPETQIKDMNAGERLSSRQGGVAEGERDERGQERGHQCIMYKCESSKERFDLKQGKLKKKKKLTVARSVQRKNRSQYSPLWYN